MTATLILRGFNGKVRACIDHTGAKSSEPKLGEELARIPLDDHDAGCPIDTLLIENQGVYFRTLQMVAA